MQQHSRPALKQFSAQSVKSLCHSEWSGSINSILHPVSRILQPAHICMTSGVEESKDANADAGSTSRMWRQGTELQFLPAPEFFIPILFARRRRASCWFYAGSVYI